MTQCIFAVEETEHERGWGQRSEGFHCFEKEEEAEVFIKKMHAKNNLPSAPDIYYTYAKAGWHPATSKALTHPFRGWVKHLSELK